MSGPELEYDKEQLRILRNAFKAFDHDEAGYIEHKDVQSILEILGQKLDDKAVKALIKEVDKSNGTKLDFGQFCKLAARFIEVEEDAGALASELKEAFRVYDKEGKGYLTVQVLRDILHELDDKISSSDLDSIIEEIDADGSGTVDFDEFMQVMTGKNFEDIFYTRRFVFQPDVYPPPRMRLHRYIECHFERFFDKLVKPFHFDFSLIKRNSPNCTVITTTHTSSTVTQPAPSLFRITQHKTDSPFGHRCYRPSYRPRFPKWVPIFTLYREIIQNPFKRRNRYMITHI